jgi:hypothetical protein
MHEYDTILKRLLMRFSPAAAAQLTGFEVRRWLNVELRSYATCVSICWAKRPAENCFRSNSRAGTIQT